MNDKKGSMEFNKIVVIVLMFFVMIVVIMWVQDNFYKVSNPTSQIGRNVSGSNTSVINMINTWNISG